MEDSQNKTIEIAPGGDVTLIVGPELVRLRVHSLFLETVSKPFAAMLKPGWKEGDHIRNRWDPVEVPLPDDSPAAMQFICAVLHHQNVEIPEELPARDVLGIAVAADKYDCTPTLKFASASWLRPREKSSNDLMILTAAAYLLRNAQAFKEITQAMLLNYSGSYLALLCDEIESIMDWRIYCRLEEARSTMRLKLAEMIVRGASDGIDECAHGCGYPSQYAYAYLQTLDSEELSPMDLSSHSILTVLKLTERMPLPIPEGSCIECIYSYENHAGTYRENRQYDLDRLVDHAGLCLHCIITGSDEASDCELKHSD